MKGQWNPRWVAAGSSVEILHDRKGWLMMTHKISIQEKLALKHDAGDLLKFSRTHLGNIIEL